MWVILGALNHSPIMWKIDPTTTRQSSGIANQMLPRGRDLIEDFFEMTDWFV